MNANFDKQRLNAIYGDSPACFRCAKKADDLHHICGRVYGLRRGKTPKIWGKEDAGIMSSVYNCAVLCRVCHERGDINHPSIKKGLLDRAKTECDMAVIEGKIQKNENDTTFLKHIVPAHIPSQKPL